MRPALAPDPVDNAQGSESKYFRFLPYLDSYRVGNHKAIWELNRPQPLVVLAQTLRLMRDVRYRDVRYKDDNPMQRGINWASAAGGGFRTLSWTAGPKPVTVAYGS